MNLFLLIKRIDPEAGDATFEKAKSLESEHKAATAETKKMNDTLQKLGRNYSNLNVAFLVLKTKVTKG
jgi:hypothetical protein